MTETATNVPSPATFAASIRQCWAQAVENVIDTGRMLVAAKEALPHGTFEKMVEEDLPFSTRTARKLMQIAQHPFLSNRTKWAVLPNNWTTLHRLSKLDEATLDQAVEAAIIRPEMTAKDIARLEPPKRGTKGRVIDVKGEEVKSDDDTPIADKGAVGERTSAEDRRDKLDAMRSKDVTPAGQVLFDALSAVERATAPNNARHLRGDRLNVQRHTAAAHGLLDVLPREAGREIAFLIRRLFDIEPSMVHASDSLPKFDPDKIEKAAAVLTNIAAFVRRQREAVDVTRPAPAPFEANETTVAGVSEGDRGGRPRTPSPDEAGPAGAENETRSAQGQPESGHERGEGVAVTSPSATPPANGDEDDFDELRDMPEFLKHPSLKKEEKPQEETHDATNAAN